mgnify:CR=1 FL=1
MSAHTINRVRWGTTLKKILLTHITAAGLAFVSGWFSSALALQEENIQIEVSKGTLLRLQQPANNIFIADPAIADIQVKSPTLVYIFGKSQGETSIYAVSDNDEVLLQGEISVSHNLGNLEAALKSVMPDAHINVRSYEGLLVLTGHVKNPDQAEEARRMAEDFIGKDSTIINRLEIATPVQVNLRVRIAEVGRNTMKQLGFNFENMFSSGSTVLGMAQGSDVFNLVENPFASIIDPVSGLPIKPEVPIPMKEFLTQGRGINSLAGGFTSGNFDINFIIDAMESEGILSVLAEPNLTTKSGESANFLAGGEFPIPIIGDDNQLNVEYKEFGVSLAFKPTVLEDGRINMYIKPEVSQLSSAGAVTLSGFSIPALTTRRAETTVEVGSGQSFAIAGLLQNNVQNDISKFPWLGDLPILGSLFRSTKFQREETELVIIVTPYIVRPHNGSSMPLPTDGFRAPNDVDLFLKGNAFDTRIADTPPALQGKEAEKTNNAAGFMLD